MSDCSGVHDGDGCDCPQPPPCGSCGRWPEYPGGHHPRCAEAPAEAQQDDEVERVAAALWEAQEGCWVAPWAELSPTTPTRDKYRRYARAALAARPSADTETLRPVLLAHHPIMRSEDGPLSGCRCGQVRLGADVIAHVAEQVLAALDGDG